MALTGSAATAILCATAVVLVLVLLLCSAMLLNIYKITFSRYQ